MRQPVAGKPHISFRLDAPVEEICLTHYGCPQEPKKLWPLLSNVRMWMIDYGTRRMLGTVESVWPERDDSIGEQVDFPWSHLPKPFRNTQAG